MDLANRDLKTDSAACLLTPLGGLGEIGKNMLAVECQDEMIIIDAGLAFPTEDQPGVDLLIPDISYIRNFTGRLHGLVLTHGHEDHVGALPYILAEMDIPVYGSRMTLGIVKNKLEEHRLLNRSVLHEVHDNQSLQLGCFTIEFIPVAHSIVDGMGLGILTPAGRIVHTGDIKLDPTPVDGRVTQLGSFGQWGQAGVDLLLADSTNVERPGYTLSEREVGASFEEIIREAKQRVVIACFSSNVHRFQQVVNAAVRFDRKIGMLGMSMIKNMRTAQDLGYLHIPEGMWLRWAEAEKLPPEKLVVLTTGSQGEGRSALARAAVGENNDLRLASGDTVIISARTIPGNERQIGNMINHMFRQGCRVHYERVSEIHVSGHAAQEELKIIHTLTKPRNFIPVHGERRHLEHHADLARQLGMAAERVLVVENGEQVRLVEGRIERGPKVAAGSVLVDGKGVGNVMDIVLRDRQHLAQDGLVVAICGIDRLSGALLSGPDVIMRGVVEQEENQRLTEAAAQVVRDVYQQETEDGRRDRAVLHDAIRAALKRYFKHQLLRFPMIMPVIIEI